MRNGSRAIIKKDIVVISLYIGGGSGLGQWIIFPIAAANDGLQLKTKRARFR